MRLSEPETPLAPVPAAEMLGHVRPRRQFAVRYTGSEACAAGDIEEYHISGAMVDGTETFVSLRLLVTAPDQKRLVFSLPGGAGAFRDTTLAWLGQTFGGNHAAVDWIGRGRSPGHDTVTCRYDPIWLDADSYRDAYLFHNIAAIWAAFDWLHGLGFVPDRVVGGSWGGVYSLLLGALDRRVAHVYSTFGCGGFSIPGIEKRSMWDAALQQMGPARAGEWFRAFDPLLRAGDIRASVYFETATNDKFFSLDMATATWEALPNRLFLALRHNQDHTMRPFGPQSYALAAIEQEGGAASLAPGRAMSRKRGTVAVNGQAMHWLLSEEEVASTALAASEQWADRGDMSRAWNLYAPAAHYAGIAEFPLTTTDPDAAALCYLTRTFSAGGHLLHAASALHRPCLRHSADGETYRDLLPAPDADPWDAPIGDKASPPITRHADAGGSAFRFGFTANRRDRVIRFGLHPWRLAPGWSTIDVFCAEGCCGPDGLALFLSCRYNRLDEISVAQSFASALRRNEQGSVVFRFARADFVPSVVIEQRFGPIGLPDATSVLDRFDAIGLTDPDGACSGDFLLRRIMIA